MLRTLFAAAILLPLATGALAAPKKSKFDALPADVQARITTGLAAHSKDELVSMIERDANAGQLLTLIGTH